MGIVAGVVGVVVVGTGEKGEGEVDTNDCAGNGEVNIFDWAI